MNARSHNDQNATGWGRQQGGRQQGGREQGDRQQGGRQQGGRQEFGVIRDRQQGGKQEFGVQQARHPINRMPDTKQTPPRKKPDNNVDLFAEMMSGHLDTGVKKQDGFKKEPPPPQQQPPPQQGREQDSRDEGRGSSSGSWAEYFGKKK